MFYAKAACYFSRHTVTNHLRSIVKLDDWTSTLDAVKKADQICKDHATTSFQLSMSQSLKEMNKRWGALQSLEAENRVLKILDWVSQVEVGKQRGEVKDKLKRYSKSGQWLMQLPSFEAWRTTAIGNFGYVELWELERVHSFHSSSRGSTSCRN